MKNNLLFKLLLLITLSVLSIFALVSCGEDPAPCEHTWDNGVIKTEPTCQTQGTKVYTCTLCGVTKTEVGKAEHKYVNNICSVCGAFTDEIDNPHLTIMDSLINGGSFSLIGKNLSLRINEETEYKIGDFVANVKLLQGGFLEGSISTDISVNNGVPVLSTIVLKDKMVYIYGDDLSALVEDEGKAPLNYGEEKAKAVYSQEELLKKLPLNLYYTLFVDKEQPQNISNIWNTLKNAPNNPLDKMLGKLIGYFFVKEQTSEGYLYSINTSFLKSLLNTAGNEPVNVLVDTLLKSGNYKSIVSLLDKILDKSVNQIETVVKTQFSSYGISMDMVITIIEKITGLEISESLEQQSNKKVYEVINSVLGLEQPLEFYKKKISEFDTLLKNNTFKELVFDPYLKEALGLEYEEFSEKIINLLKCAYISYSVNPGYEFTGGNVRFNNFDFSETVNDKQYSLSLNGEISFGINK